METTKIMRGDWLFYRGRFNVFPFRVEQITKKKIGYHVEPNECRMYYLRACECEPIPLTEDIMQRNFPDPSKITWFPLDAESGCFNVYWEHPSFGDGEVRLNIQYVHELQHILKLCNIDKEIEL